MTYFEKMRIALAIGTLFILFGASCASSKITNERYLEKYADSSYISDSIIQSGAAIGFFSYRTSSNEEMGQRNKEEVKRVGLILKAKSVLSNIVDRQIVFGDKKNSCHAQFTMTVKRVREGRSALESVDNFSSSLKGKPYQRQRDPYTWLSSVESSGTLNLQDQAGGFYYSYDRFKKSNNEGWLILKGDTITVKHLYHAGHERGFWMELSRDNIIYGAIDIGNDPGRRVYILKNLSEGDKLLIATFFSIAAYSKNYFSAL